MHYTYSEYLALGLKTTAIFAFLVLDPSSFNGCSPWIHYSIFFLYSVLHWFYVKIKFCTIESLNRLRRCLQSVVTLYRVLSQSDPKCIVQRSTSLGVCSAKGTRTYYNCMKGKEFYKGKQKILYKTFLEKHEKSGVYIALGIVLNSER